MLERGISAKSASSLFYEEINDLDIFIEDRADGYRKIFKELLNKALGTKFKISQIFPIGSRDEVIKLCERNQTSADRKKVYIVDGDLYLLNGNDRSDLKGLYILPRYCVENYFFSEVALVETAYEEDSEMELEEIASKLNFKQWFIDNEKLLIELFIYYALCHKYVPTEQTIHFKVNKLCQNNSGIVSADKIKLRIEDLKEKLILFFGEERLLNEIKIIRERITIKDKQLLRYVSGKDYLLPLMIMRLQSFLKFNPGNTQLRIRLAKRSDVSELQNIEDYII